MDIRKNLSLIIGLSIPVVVLIVITLAVTLPRLFSSPTYNFLYTTDQVDYYYARSSYRFYSVENKKLIVEPRPSVDPKDASSYGKIPERTPSIYVFDVTTNRSREVTYEEAAKLTLDINDLAPDGFRIENGGRNGIIPEIVGGSSDYGKKYLVGHGVRREITLMNSPSYSYYNFRFFGWIIP